MSRGQRSWRRAGWSLLVAAALSCGATAQSIDEKAAMNGSEDYQRAVEAWFRGLEPKVIGGKPATAGQFPWQVSLDVSWISDLYRAHFCGGSIYADEWIVTAAHCVVGTRPQDIVVTAGTTDLTTAGVRRNVKEIVVIKGYVGARKGKDIALLRLFEKLPLGPQIQAIPLVEAEGFEDATRFTVTGWGATSQGGRPVRQLQFLENLPHVPLLQCNRPLSYDGAIKPDMVCAGFAQGGVDSCQGDSGGPLTVHTEQGVRLAGIVSWGEGCGQPLKYGVYTRVAKYTDWIRACVASSLTCERR